MTISIFKPCVLKIGYAFARCSAACGRERYGMFRLVESVESGSGVLSSARGNRASLRARSMQNLSNEPYNPHGITMQYWLMKSEPDAFGIDDLAARPKQTEHWDGVRNYQARNMMRDQMRLGDQILFYHSNCETPGVVGVAEVARESYPDFSAWNPESKYYDPTGPEERPRWFMVDVKFVRKLKRTISLTELRENPALSEMQLIRKGNRLSVMPVAEDQWHCILAME